MPVILDLVRAMLIEGQRKPWLEARIGEIPEGAVAMDYAASLVKSLEPEVEHRVRQVFLFMAEPFFLELLADASDPVLQMRLRTQLLAAYVMVADGEPISQLRGDCLVGAANYAMTLAKMQVEPFVNLQLAIDLCVRSRDEGHLFGTMAWANSLFTQGGAYFSLGLQASPTLDALDASTSPNLHLSIAYFQRAREEGFAPGTVGWASTLRCEGYAHQQLAVRNENSVENVERSIVLFRRSLEEGTPKNSPFWIENLLSIFQAHIALGSIGDAPVKHYEQALEISERCRSEGLRKGTPEWDEIASYRAFCQDRIAELRT